MQNNGFLQNTKNNLQILRVFPYNWNITNVLNEIRLIKCKNNKIILGNKSETKEPLGRLGVKRLFSNL